VSEPVVVIGPLLPGISARESVPVVEAVTVMVEAAVGGIPISSGMGVEVDVGVRLGVGVCVSVGVDEEVAVVTE